MPAADLGRDLATPLTREIRQWYGDPSTGTVGLGFEKVAGQKLSSVIPSRDMLVSSSSSSKVFRLTPAPRDASERKARTSAPASAKPDSAKTRVTAGGAAASNPSSATSSNMMRWDWFAMHAEDGLLPRSNTGRGIKAYCDANGTLSVS